MVDLSTFKAKMRGPTLKLLALNMVQDSLTSHVNRYLPNPDTSRDYVP